MDGHGGLPVGASARLESSAQTRGFFLLAVSPKLAFFDQYLKLPRNAMLFMPPWELDEIIALREALFSEVAEELAEELFDVFGGAPRQVLQLAGSSDQGSSRNRLEIAIQAAAHTLPSVLSQGALVGSAVSDEVLLIQVPILEHPGPKAYDFYNCGAVFRSRHVANRIMQSGKAAASAATLLHISTMLKPAAAVAGALFEPAALFRLLQGGTFRVKLFPPMPEKSWKLFSSSVHDGELSLSLPFVPDDAVVTLKRNSFELIRSLAIGQFGVPSNTNFPLVDYVLLLDGLTVLFNAKVGDEHPLNKDALLALLQNLPPSASRNVAFLFVVPETSGNLTSFLKFRATNFKENATAVEGACLMANAGPKAVGQARVRFSLCLGVLAIPMPVTAVTALCA